MNIEINLMQALPEIILAAAGILVLVTGQFIKNGNGNFIKILSLAGLFIALAVVVNMTADANGAFVVDTFSIFFKILFISASIIVVLGSFSTIKTIHESEYYSLILFITLGMCVVASARELILLFVGIELAGISSFILAAYAKEDRRSSEAGIKYLIIAAVQKAHEKNLKIIAGITGDNSNIRPDISNPSVRTNIVNIYSRLVSERGFDGYRYDIEIIP